MRLIKSFVAAGVFFSLLCVYGYSNGFNLNGLGARAMALGGAFVGLADDFSAVYWNPAGIGYFKEKHIGAYGTGNFFSASYKSNYPNKEVDAQSNNNFYGGGLISFVSPMMGNFVAGVGVYTPVRFKFTWDSKKFAPFSMNNENIEWGTSVRMITFSPVIAFKIQSIYSIGASLNLNYSTFSVDRHAGSEAFALDLGQYRERLNGWGLGFSLGLMIRPSKSASAGVSFRSASRIIYKGSATISNSSALKQAPTFESFNGDLESSSPVEKEILWPFWLACGFQYKPNERIMLLFDIHYTGWSSIDYLYADYANEEWKTFMYEMGKDVIVAKWEDSVQFRLGFEYLFKVAAIRIGYYYDQTPVQNETLGIQLPFLNSHNFTCGAGFSLNKVKIDFGFEYRMGIEKDIPYARFLVDPEYRNAMPGTYDMSVMAINLAVSYHF
jgi:long-chain fatty acid transport protein